MNSKIGTFQLPISAMNIFNNLSILILVPLFEQFLYPAIKNAGFDLSMLKKIGLGFVCAVLAMLNAALLEVYRVKYTPAAAKYGNTAAQDNISPCK